MAGRQAAKFLEGSLMRHIIVMSLTSSIGLMAVFLVDLINMVYISWLGQHELEAAIGYAGAILFFTSSIGIGISIAVSALVAQAIGLRDRRLARDKATSGMVLGLFFGTLMAVGVWAFLHPMVTFLGATGEVHALTLHYVQIVTLGQPLLTVGMIGAAILRSYGDARAAMMATVWGAMVIAVLDPIFLFVFHMDLTGVAIASLISRAVILVMALRPIIRRYGGFARFSFTAVLEDLRPVFTIALPAILAQIATPFGQAYVTRAASSFGEGAVAGMAITGRIVPVAFAFLFALAGALGPIIGQNFGAGRMDRVKRAYLDAVLFTAVVSVVVSILLYLLRAPIADLFRAEGVTRDIVYLFCGPLSLLWFFNGVIFASSGVCNNLGRPFFATLVNWGRQTLGIIPFVLWFGQIYGAQGVLIGQSLGGVLFGFVAYFLARQAIKNPNEAVLGLPHALREGGDQANETVVPGERRA